MPKPTLFYPPFDHLWWLSANELLVIQQKGKKIIAVFQIRKSGLNKGLLVMCSIVVWKRPISLNLYALTKKKNCRRNYIFFKRIYLEAVLIVRILNSRYLCSSFLSPVACFHHLNMRRSFWGSIFCEELELAPCSLSLSQKIHLSLSVPSKRASASLPLWFSIVWFNMVWLQSCDMWVWGSGALSTLNTHTQPPNVFILPSHIA